jgi:hypothetical protein
MPKSISCNIAILPSAKIVKKTIAASKKLKKEGTLFTLDNNDYYPHMSIYRTAFPSKNFPAIEKKLGEIMASVKVFDINSEDYHQSKGGYVDIGFKRNKVIAGLHKKIIKSLNPLREGEMLYSDVRNFNSFEKWEQKNIKLYGCTVVGKKYRPHITFTKLQKRKRNKNVISAIPKDNFSFKADTIAFLISGKHGVGRKVLKLFKLNN